MLRHHKGKTFSAPSRLFRASRALYFPNLQGRTLASPDPTDTTPVLRDKISLVAIYSGTWAERQTQTFTSASPSFPSNGPLHTLLASHPTRLQKVELNIEENSFKAGLITFFMSNLRRGRSTQERARYFLIRRGLDEHIRDAMAMLNSKVGYVFLVDAEARIRWAASGLAEEGEREALERGVRRLLDEAGPEGQGERQLHGKLS